MIEKIVKEFSDRVPKSIEKYKEAAVMILLVEEKGELNIIFEVRAKKLKSQPGDVCLPGGKIDNGESPREAAVREVKEELNILDDNLEVIGDMDYFISPYGLMLHSVVGQTTQGEINPNKDEVDHIFKVPLKFFLDSEPLLYEMKIGPIDNEKFPFHLVNNGKDYKFRNGILKEYFYKYNEYVIWGYTALVVKAFVDRFKSSKN